MTLRRSEPYAALVGIIIAFTFNAFAARETPLFSNPPKTPDGAFEFLHDGEEEAEVPIFLGRGATREALIICFHTDGEVMQWKIHPVRTFPAPEPLAEPGAVKP